MGTTSAYVYSSSVIVACMVPSFHGHHFFETSALLLTFVVLGKLMESHAKGRTSDALTKLMALQPSVALLMSTDGDGGPPVVKSIPISHVQAGDVLKVLPGASVPTDGLVFSGTSTVDEAMVTGESMPVVKKPGEEVYGGTINHHGTLLIRATRVGEDSAIRQIVRLVEDAQTSKAPIQQYADKISAIFAPTVVGLSTLTFLFWIIMLSSGYAPDSWDSDIRAAGNEFVFSFSLRCCARHRVPVHSGLPSYCGHGRHGRGCPQRHPVKGGLARHKVSALVFDKTGTLTPGTPSVASLRV